MSCFRFRQSVSDLIKADRRVMNPQGRGWAVQLFVKNFDVDKEKIEIKSGFKMKDF